MFYRRQKILPFRIGVLISAFVLTPSCLSVVAQDAVEDAVESALSQLDEGQFEPARRALAGLSGQSAEQPWKARILFYQALVDHEQAETLNDENGKRQLLQGALALYASALRERPDWGPALNNLAQVHDLLGQPDDAAAAYEQAIALADDKQPFYTENYAGSLAQNGRPRDAVRFYRLVAAADQQNSEVHQRLVQLYLELDAPDDLVGYLWHLDEQGLVTRSQQTALDLLEDGLLDGDAGQSSSLLALLALTLSKQHPLPGTVAATSLGERLEQLGERPELAAPIEELLRVLSESPQFSEFNYQWWSNAFDRNRDTEHGLWPKDAFVRLICSIGDAIRFSSRNRRGEAAATRWSTDDDQIEQYYKLAAFFFDPDASGSRDVDPEALLKLADLYVCTGTAKQRLDALLDEYEGCIFAAKNTDYRNHWNSQRPTQLQRLYKFHSALGMIYSQLGISGGPYDARSTIFQLQHAIDVAKLHNERFVKTGRVNDNIQVQPRVADILAAAWRDAGDDKEAYQVRLNLAEDFMKFSLNDWQAASQVVSKAELPADDLSNRKRLDQLDAWIKSNRTQYRSWWDDPKRQDREHNETPDDKRKESSEARVEIVNVATSTGKSLDPSLQRQLESALNSLVQQQRSHGLKPNRYMLLGHRSHPNLVDVQIQDGRGRAQFREDSQSLDAHFVVEGRDSNSIQTLQAVRP